MPVQRLTVTNGTDSVSFLPSNGGLRLQDWRPAILGLRGGGTSRTPLFAPGSSLVQADYDDVTDAFTLVVADCQDEVYEQLQDLIRLLEQGRNYWLAPYATEPVWLEVQGPNETNVRYAVVKDWQIPQLQDNPFGPPISDQIGLQETIIVTVRHEIWRADEPGTYTCVETSAQQPFTQLADELVEVSTAQADDGYTAWNTFQIATTDLFAGNSGGTNMTLYETGMRFRAVSVPAGATITNAWLELQASATLATTTVNWSLKAELNATPAAFQAGAAGWTDFYSRIRTTNRTGWPNVAAWTINLIYSSPDISNVLQEVVDLAGWATGNDLVIFVQDTDENPSTVGAYRQWYSWDDPAGNTPELHILYSTGDGYGREATCTAECFVANKHVYSQLTDVYHYDADLVVWSSNLMDLIASPLPQNLLPAAPANNDIIYFGIDSTHPAAGPFSNLVFDIGTAAAYTTGGGAIIARMDWEYWNGAWVALTVCDNTGYNQWSAVHPDNKPFRKTGVDSVHWKQPSDWATTTINGVLGYWVRAIVVTAGGGAVSTPTQQNREIYTSVTPFVDIDEAQVPGDIPLLSMIHHYGKSDWFDNTGGVTAWQTDLYLSRILIGLRSKDRGREFTPYLNFSQTHLLPGCQVNSGVHSAFASTPVSQSGDLIRVSFAGATAALTQEAGWYVLNGVQASYRGEFRAFLRYLRTGGADDDILFRMVTSTYAASAGWGLGATISTPVLTMPVNGSEISLLDLGKITLPPGGVPEDGSLPEVFGFEIYLQNVPAAARVIDLYDLILMPADEMLIDTIQPVPLVVVSGTGTSLGYDAQILLDSVTTLRANPDARHYEYVLVYNNYIGKWQVASAGLNILQPNRDQRLWFLTQRMRDGAAPPFAVDSELHMAVDVDATARYEIARGSR